MLFRLIFTILIIICISCNQATPIAEDKDFVTIGTFNIAWLGDGINDRIDRIEDDYKQIANLINQTGIEVLGLQEIENEKAIKKILAYLPDYDFIMANKHGAQNIALIYKKYIDIKFISEYMPLAIQENRNRPGLIIEAKKGNFDWIMMIVHFKSTSHYDDTPEKKEDSYYIRTLQAEKTVLWADSVIKNSKEKDIIIMGDFNDTPNRKKNNSLTSIKNSNLFFLTDSLKSCKFPTWYSIDHILVSQSAKIRYLENSIGMYDFNKSISSKQSKSISDHCPVFAKFEIKTPDND